MKKLLQIGAALNCGAPGRITEQIGLLAMQHGWTVYQAHGLRHSNPSALNSIPMVTKNDERIHALYSLLLDRHGLGPARKTYKLVEWIEENKPDIIHLHNLHGYFLNFRVLFEFLRRTDIPIVWTLHDCWPFTGHCAYFDSVDCMKWQTGCSQCPLKKEYPKSLFLDRSKNNYELKKDLFVGLKSVTIVPVSDWLGEITKKSFLGEYPIKVIHNGVDINVFRPMRTDLRKRMGITDNRTIVLGLASPWIKRKGYDDMILLSQNHNFQLIMVGVSESQKKVLPSNIISVCRTSNVQELAEYYNMADVFINPTYSDNFPTTNIEALACGTPVITYKTGGSPEAIDEQTGVVVEQGDLKGLVNAVQRLRENPLSGAACRERAETLFDKDKCFEEYLSLYEELSADR